MPLLPAEQDNTSSGPPEWLAGALLRMAASLPPTMRYRVRNTLDQFERAILLFEIDREMASFRAITGEEEAATTLMRAIQLRRYPEARRLKLYRHQHKAAMLACVLAIGSTMAPLLKEFQLTFDFDRRRIDVKVPLSVFGVRGDYAIQPVEPLDLLHSRPGGDEQSTFDEALKALAERSNFASIRKLVDEQANARNGLLYASDSAVPKSKATLSGIELRQQRGIALLVLAIMVYQSRKQLGLVRQALPAFLDIITRLPA